MERVIRFAGWCLCLVMMSACAGGGGLSGTSAEQTAVTPASFSSSVSNTDPGTESVSRPVGAEPSAITGSREKSGAVTRRSPVVEVVEDVSPAVVNISTEQRVEVNPFWRHQSPSPFDWFGRNFNDGDRRYVQNSLGSGVIIDSEGHVLTNQHVILQGSRIMVTLADNREFEAELVGSDPKSDLAILKINTESPLPHVEMGTSSDLMIGETVIAIGNPYGLNHTVTTGVISAIGRTMRTESRVFHDFIQTDASINPGNSGGPLLNINGDLVGINTAIYGGGAQNIGFTIPIDRAKRIVDDLIRFGTVVPAWVGLQVQDLNSMLAESFNFPLRSGALVTETTESGPAADAGLKRGDIVTGLGDQQIESARHFQEGLRGYTAGDEIGVTYYREGRKLTARVASVALSMSMLEDEIWKRVGIEVIEITDDLALRYRLPSARGVVIRRVREGSPAFDIGLDGGDVILLIDGVQISSLSDIGQAIVPALGRGTFSLMIQRGRHRYRGVLEF